jgi:hypothetical protein
MAIALIGLALCGCGKKQSEALAPPPGTPVKNIAELPYKFAPGAIKIGIIASKELNLTRDVPAGLSLCLFQLGDLATFASNSKTTQGLGQLLACQDAAAQGAPAPSGVVGATRLFIQPGETRDLVIDRLDGTKYVAVAGGYSSLPAPGAAAFLLIPVHENKKWFFANTFQLEELDAWLLLKGQSLEFFPKLPEDLKASAADFADKPLPEPPRETYAACPAQAPCQPATASDATMGQPATPTKTTTGQPATDSKANLFQKAEELPTTPFQRSKDLPSAPGQPAPAAPTPPAIPPPPPQTK